MSGRASALFSPTWLGPLIGLLFCKRWLCRVLVVVLVLVSMTMVWLWL